ncbi:hypothetical protein AVEN_117172-1 [Araneus ventricosus]|uniref:Uncharacterized protein n=1 Tax=Araneus ventricosus TaxID=182803 RepID=A0A4Y2AZE6_ARAVE|nr:hypothetical protein AVEN_117172-1 [Araneus ventricosus]
MTDKEIVPNINAEIYDEENEELDQQEPEKVTVKEAEKAVELLQSFLESIENNGTKSFGASATLEKKLRKRPTFLGTEGGEISLCYTSSFWDGPRHFEPLSYAEDETCVGTFFPKFQREDI